MPRPPQTHLRAVVNEHGTPDGTATIMPIIASGLQKLADAEKARRIVERGTAGSDCLLWPYRLDADGYGAVWDPEEGKIKRAHRAAYERWFNTKIPADRVACHSCDTPACINPFHIFIGTHQDNQADKVSKGRHARGEASGMAKLTREQALEIRNAVEESRKELAERFGVTTALIGMIQRGEIWR